MIPHKPSTFLGITFSVPEYTGELPVFDPGDVVELPEKPEVENTDQRERKSPGDSPERLPRLNKY